MDIFSDALSQYIDIDGKTRMLTFDNNLSLMISPIKPLELPIDPTIYECSIEDAINFIENYNLKIISQDVIKENDEIFVKGIFLNHPLLYYSYIPVQKSEAIKDASIADVFQLDPLR